MSYSFRSQVPGKCSSSLRACSVMADGELCLEDSKSFLGKTQQFADSRDRCSAAVVGRGGGL